MLTSVFMLVLCAVQAQRVTMTAHNVTLKTAMAKLKKQTGYSFVFKNGALSDLNKRVDIDVKDAPISKVVEIILAGQSVHYKIQDKTIIVTRQNGTPQRNDNLKPKGRATGRVVDNKGEPVIGATVKLKGSNAVTVTDINGDFSIDAPEGSSIIFSYIGFNDTEAKASEHMQVTMSEDVHALEDVVVIGYGSARKTDLTGSVSLVKMSDVGKEPVVSIDNALQGRIAGADFLSTSGEPGATTTIRIRGTRSINATNEPLFVVDGVMDGVSSLDELNPNDIKSISVLKDASSTAIYGSRGSNGVIIIETKSGQEGKLRINFKTDLGISELPRKLDLMNATEYAQFRNDYAIFATNDNYGSVGSHSPMSSMPYPDPDILGEGTDWIDAITRKAPYQNYDVSLQGGSTKMNYFASTSYNNTKGIIKNSGMERFTGRLKLNLTLSKAVKMGFNVYYSRQQQHPNVASIGGTNWWNAAMFVSPLIAADADYNPYWYSGQKFNSPLALINQVVNRQDKNASTYSSYIELTPIHGLKLRSQLTFYQYQQHNYKYEPSTLPAKTKDAGGDATRSESDSYSLLSETTATYDLMLKHGHSLNLMGGSTAYTAKSNSLSVAGKGYLLDETTWNNLGGLPNKENYTISSSNNKKSKMSFLARFNYNYKERYYVTFTGRWDGASNFAQNNKWGFFPSSALRWNIKNEPFMKSVSWIDVLALRASYGRTGNDGISPYRSLSAMASSTSGYLFGGSQPVAFYPSRLASDNLTWEKTDMWNLATDFELFHHRLKITAEIYQSNTSDLLLSAQIPVQTGYTSRFGNFGKTRNRGWELSVEGNIIAKSDYGWTATVNLSHNSQEVTDIGTNTYVSAYDSYNPKYMMYGYKKGYPLNALWGFVYAGTWKSQEEIDRNEITKAYCVSAKAYKTPGCGRYLDINHDGVLNEEDLVYLGNADPTLIMGLQNSFRYKQLSLGVYCVWSLGGKIYNVSEQWLGQGGPNTNQYRYMLDAWHPVRNPYSDIPRAASNDGLASSRLVHSATYFRLKNISLGYDLDVTRLTRHVLQNIRFSATAENLWLWKRYNGFDPDVSSSGTSSTLRRADVGAYPKPRSYVFSMQITY